MATRVLITGATGLLGAHTVAACAQMGMDVRQVDREVHDLLSPDAVGRVLDEFRPAAVVHLAWSASGTPGYRESTDNALWVERSLDLWRACVDRGVRLLAVGTVVDRPASPASHDAYTTSKIALREALAPHIETGELCWLRPHYVFDPVWERPALVRAALDAVRTQTHAALSSPGAVHDFVHAHDVGSAIATAVRERLIGAVDIGSGRCHSVATLVERLGARWERSPRNGPTIDHDEGAADIRLLRAHGWAPTVTEEFFDHG